MLGVFCTPVSFNGISFLLVLFSPFVYTASSAHLWTGIKMTVSVWLTLSRGCGIVIVSVAGSRYFTTAGPACPARAGGWGTRRR